MNFIVTFILFLLLLTVIVTIHEFGHFIAAKIFNVYVSEFSIGMGNRIFCKKGKETTFSIRLLPIGGYCSMVGDNENDLEKTPDVDETEVPFERTLNGIAPIKKMIILLAGVLMNCVLALVIVSMIYLSFGKIYQSPEPIINEVNVDSPAYNAGLMHDDKIIKCELVNGYSINPDKFSDVSSFFSLYEDGPITLTIERNGETIEVELTPTYSKENESYIIGIQSYDNEIVEINLLNCFKYGFDYLVLMTKMILTTLFGLFRGVGLNNLSGPVGIFQATSTAASAGFLSYILLVAIFSLNIGLFNLIPIPLLDGGRLVITIVETLAGRKLPKKVESFIMTASLVLFLAIMFFATSQDIMKLIR